MPGTAHGASLHHELELLVAAGLAPIAALTSATAAPADFFGLIDRGRITPGRRADLLFCRQPSDPLHRVRRSLPSAARMPNGRDSAECLRGPRRSSR